MLQSLSELQLAAASVATSVRTVAISPDSDSKLRRQGLMIVYLADSLAIAEGYEGTKLKVSLAKEFVDRKKRSRSLALPLRCSALMLGELTEAAPQLRIPGKTTLTLDVDQHVLKLRYNNVIQYYFVDDRSEPCWAAWLGRQSMDPSDLYAHAVAGLANELEQGMAGVIGDVLRDHSDIADKYVEVRTNVLKSGLAN